MAAAGAVADRRQARRPAVPERSHWYPAYVGLGSNLDRPAGRVREALRALTTLPHTRVVAASRLYDAAPVGFLDQPPFVNAAAAVITRLAPAALHESLMALERQLGKAPPSVRFGPRRIDLDLLAYSDLVLAEPALTVPHPRLHERAFVLYPLNDIAPALWLPGRGRVATLARAVDGSGVSLAAGEIE